MSWKRIIARYKDCDEETKEMHINRIKKIRAKNSERVLQFLLVKEEEHSKKKQMYENKKLIKTGKLKSYRKRKFESWQKRKHAA